MDSETNAEMTGFFQGFYGLQDSLWTHYQISASLQHPNRRLCLSEPHCPAGIARTADWRDCRPAAGVGHCKVPSSRSAEAQTRQVDPVFVGTELFESRIYYREHLTFHPAPAVVPSCRCVARNGWIRNPCHGLCRAAAAPTGWRRSVRVALRRKCFGSSQRPVEQRHLRRDDDERQIAALNPRLGQRAMRKHTVEILDGISPLTTTVEEQDHGPAPADFRVVPSRQVHEVLPALAGDLAVVSFPEKLVLAAAPGLGGGVLNSSRQRDAGRQRSG